MPVKVNIKRRRGAHLEVCEEVLNYCPYCGSKRIKELAKTKHNTHAVYCNHCYGIFKVPCED